MSRNTSLVDLNQTHFDAVTVAYPDSVTEVYTFRKGGLSGQVALTLTIVYTSAAKTLVQSIIRVPSRIG